MPDNTNNSQGKRGEDIFAVRITQNYIFQASDLGEKWPISDFYIEVNDIDNPLFFIVQIKSSSRYNKNGDLKISISKKKVKQLANYNAPTYIAGIDVEKEIVFLKSVNKELKSGIYSISSKKLYLDFSRRQESQKNLENLKNEVIEFWKLTNTKSTKINFKSII